MSQKKVEQYKKEKVNRKESIRKEKAKHKITVAVVSVVALVLVCWFGYSVVNSIEATKAAQAVEVNYDAFNNCLSGM